MAWWDVYKQRYNELGRQILGDSFEVVVRYCRKLEHETLSSTLTSTSST